jgi:hypothetical protein
MGPKLKVSKDSKSPKVDATEYRSLIGSLRYLLHTKPELTYSVSYLSWFMENPRQEHMGAIKHLLRYVEGILDHGLLYPRGDGGNFGILGYCDSDMAGDIDDCKSTTGLIFFIACSPITWNSQKQRVVALS